MPDCMICFGPVRRPWAPDLPCDCRPVLHRACWNSWSRHVGYPSCVICRNQPVRAPLPLLPAPDAAPPAGRPFTFGDDVAPFIAMFFFIWMIMIMSYPRQVMYVTDPPRYHPPYPYRDEL
jgi:hypothetical protein